MEFLIILIFLGVAIWATWLNKLLFNEKRVHRVNYYQNVYLKSNAWQRKRYVVLKRDNWKCVFCGNRATQVHHERYARNIGNEPIKWLVSTCTPCHDKQHSISSSGGESSHS